MHGHQRQPGQPMAEINVIPLVDISLVLLIIFMVTTAFVKEAGLNMQLPKAQATEAEPEKSQDINIAIDKKSKTYINGKPTTMAHLVKVLENRARKKDSTRVIIKADRAIAYDRFVNVLDAVKVAGLYRIAIATEPKPTDTGGSLQEVASHAKSVPGRSH